MESAAKEFNHYRGLLIARKQLCMEAVDSLSEGLGKKVKDVLVTINSFPRLLFFFSFTLAVKLELSLETDQDVGWPGPPPPLVIPGSSQR